MVQSSGCLGNCSNAPNALLVDGHSERIFAKLCSLSASAEVVERASGRAPNLEDAEMVARLQRARRVRIRTEAREESKWNLALAGLAEDVAHAEDEESRMKLVHEQAELLASAGFAGKAAEVLSTVVSFGDLSLQDIPKLRLLLENVRILARMGRVLDIGDLSSRMDRLQPRNPRETDIKSQVSEIICQTIIGIPEEIAVLERDDPAGTTASRPLRVQDYARWRVHAITSVSKHSVRTVEFEPTRPPPCQLAPQVLSRLRSHSWQAIYHFHTDDDARGTPIRKGRGGRTVWSRTWHTTLLAEVGEANAEGPLPWIERDYTPISTAQDWEQGRCDILIKLYLEPAGLATEWLHRVSETVPPGGTVGAGHGVAGAGPTVWLSRPMKTLHVPSLSLDQKYINRKHASILLLVAGSGVVLVPQVLHHTNPTTCFGGRPVVR